MKVTCGIRRNAPSGSAEGCCGRCCTGTVRLERFEIRRGSGGGGQWIGGDGLVRHFRFLKPVQISLLTQRRILAPFGMEGGESGTKGKNLRVTAEGPRLDLNGSTSYAAEAGEELIIETPGGGGWGCPIPSLEG